MNSQLLVTDNNYYVNQLAATRTNTGYSKLAGPSYPNPPSVPDYPARFAREQP
jgi:hypothetical protein